MLNALVAADPAKQRWLLSVGVLPLLQRLCEPLDPEGQLEALANPNAMRGGDGDDSARGPGGAGVGYRFGSKRTTGGHGGDGDDLARDQAAAGTATAAAAFVAPVAAAAAALGKGIAGAITGMLPAALRSRRAEERGPLAAAAAAAGGDGAGAGGGAAVAAGETAGEAGSEEEGGALEAAAMEEPEMATDHQGPSDLCLRRQVRVCVWGGGCRPFVGLGAWAPRGGAAVSARRTKSASVFAPCICLGRAGGEAALCSIPWRGACPFVQCGAGGAAACAAGGAALCARGGGRRLLAALAAARGGEV